MVIVCDFVVISCLVVSIVVLAFTYAMLIRLLIVLCLVGCINISLSVFVIVVGSCHYGKSVANNYRVEYQV